jgi:HK97 family phage major capsid protein
MTEMTSIREYISTAMGSAGTLLIPKVILPTLVEEATKKLLPREMARFVLGPAQLPGSSTSANLETESTLNVNEVAEGAELPLDALGYSSVTFTPKKYGVAIRITREMMEDSQFPLLEGSIRAAGRRFAENENNLVITALDGANSTVSGGAAITIANITSAMLNVENQDYIPTDLIVGNEVLNDLRNIDTFVEANKIGNTDMLQRGFLGTIYGMNVVSFSTNAAPSTTYAKYAYVLDRSQAYGIAIKRDITVENFALPTYDMQAAAVTQRIDVKLLRSKAVSKITTS